MEGCTFFEFTLRHVMTGSYHNYFHIYDKTSRSEYTLQADKSAFKARRAGTAKSKLGLVGRSKTKKEDINPDNIDFQKKILHASWHPREYSVAVAATNNLFLFSTL
jgi:serine/threonine-protein phosphatase 2A regulatory subunit B